MQGKILHLNTPIQKRQRFSSRVYFIIFIGFLNKWKFRNKQNVIWKPQFLQQNQSGQGVFKAELFLKNKTDFTCGELMFQYNMTAL